MRFNLLAVLVLVTGCAPDVADSDPVETDETDTDVADTDTGFEPCSTTERRLADTDGDGYGDPNNYVQVNVCDEWEDGYVPSIQGQGDCDDGDSSIHPDTLEVHGNDLDDDCDPATEDAPAYIVTTTVSTIWYVDEYSLRYAFPSPQVFLTWEDSYDVVTEVSDEYASSLTLGGNMAYKPGTVLIKSQSDPKVYAVTENPDSLYSPIIRWIQSESLAEEIYGANWSDYVMDVPDWHFLDYVIGEAVDEPADLPGVDLSVMKTRAELDNN